MAPNTTLAKSIRPLQNEQHPFRNGNQATSSSVGQQQTGPEKELVSLAHDLRAVVNVLTGTSEALAQTGLSSDQMHLVETMQFGTDNLLALVNNFLDFTKLQAADIDFYAQPFDLCELIFSLQKAMQMRVNGRNVDILTEIDPLLNGLFPVLDVLMLRKILFNLLDNALKFTRQGMVTLRVRLAKPDILEFQVIDTGPGIPPEAIASIFRPFWQIKGQSAGGTGLGLTIVQELTERQGGSIQVESRLNEGSAFIVTLPFERNSSSLLAGPTPAHETIEPDALRDCSLLAVDDNPLSQRLLRRLFDTWDCEYVFASNAAEAIELTEKRPFDLILLDVNLPDQDGLALAALIRRSDSGKNRQTPLIGLSGAMLPKSSLRGFDSFVEKPFTPVGLLAVLNGFWQKVKASRPQLAPIQLDFTYLLSFCEGDRQFAAEIVELFLQNAPEAINQLQTAALERNTHLIYQLAHRLKSNYFTLGIHSLENRCISLERLCQIPTTDDSHIIQLAEQLATQSRACLTVIRQHLTTLR